MNWSYLPFFCCDKDLLLLMSHFRSLDIWGLISVSWWLADDIWWGGRFLNWIKWIPDRLNDLRIFKMGSVAINASGDSGITMSFLLVILYFLPLALPFTKRVWNISCGLYFCRFGAAFQPLSFPVRFLLTEKSVRANTLAFSSFFFFFSASWSSISVAIQSYSNWNTSAESERKVRLTPVVS